MRMSVNPIRLFITHAWAANDDYTRVFEYLEASGNFYYVNTSLPHAKQPIDKESQREELRRQIAPCEVVIVLPGVYRAAPELVLFQMNFAKAAERPIVAMENFGSTEPVAKAIKDLADEVSAWNERNVIDALRRQARHQESTRWDTIEFKLD
jgi:orotidine-5'-phosphate decarboxylase